MCPRARSRARLSVRAPVTSKKAPRKQPTQGRSRALVASVVAATEALAAEMGVAAVTMPMIAKRSGVSLASIYEYFPTKEAVLAAWAETTWERALQAAFKELERAIAVEKRSVHQGVERVIGIVNRELRVFARACGALAFQDLVGRTEVRLQHAETLRQMLEGLFLSVPEVTKVKVRSPVVAARLVATLLTADSYVSYLGAVTDEAAADAEVADLLRRYLGGDP